MGIDVTTLCLIAAGLFAAGGAMQKHAVATRIGGLRLRDIVSRKREFLRALGRNRIWLLGFAVAMAGAPFSIQAMAMGDVSVVKALMRIQILFSAGIGVGLLGERLERLEWLGLVCLGAGVGILATHAGAPESVAPGTSASALLFAGSLCASAALLALSRFSRGRFREEYALALASGLLLGAGDVLLKAGTGVVAANVGGFDVSRAETLLAFVATPELYLSLGCDVSAFFLAQAAFSSGRVSVIVPLSGTGAIICTVVLACAVLGESLPGARLAGIATILAGTLVLAVGGGWRTRAQAAGCTSSGSAAADSSSPMAVSRRRASSSMYS